MSIKLNANIQTLPDVDIVDTVIDIIVEELEQEILVEKDVSVQKKLREELTAINKKLRRFKDATKESIADTVLFDFQSYMKDVFLDGCTVYSKDYFINDWNNNKCSSFPMINTKEKALEVDEECSIERDAINSVSNVLFNQTGITLVCDDSSFKDYLKNRLKDEKNSHFSQTSIIEKIKDEIVYNYGRFDEIRNSLKDSPAKKQNQNKLK
jgi:hypothetical protein